MDVAGISVRGPELAAVTEVLETDFDSADQAARAVLKTAMTTLLQRDWWLVVASDLDLVYGLYATETAAVKAAIENSLGVFGTVKVVHIHSAENRIDYVRNQP